MLAAGTFGCQLPLKVLAYHGVAFGAPEINHGFTMRSGCSHLSAGKQVPEGVPEAVR